MSIKTLRVFSIVIGLYFCSSHSDGLSVQCNGCIVSGDCKPHGSRWYDSNLCIDFRCRRYRQRQGEKQHFVYELLPDSDGCPYNNTCLKFGTYSDNKEECTRYNCYKTYEHTPILQKFYHGHNLIPKPYGCPDGGKCRDDKEEWDDSCSKMRCIVAGNKTEIHSERKAIGCYDNGKYRQESETWKEECHTKICRDGRIEIKVFGCHHNGTCRELHETWREDCNMRKCYKNKEGKATVGYTETGCRDEVHGVCRKVNEKWSDKYYPTDCSLKTCLMFTKDRRNDTSPRVEIITKGCIDADDNCKPRGNRGSCY